MKNNERSAVRELRAIELDQVSGGCNCPPGGCPGATNVSYRTSGGQTYVTYLDCDGHGHFYEKLQS